MARPPQEFVELAKRFVCVRVTDMRHVDIDRFRFDFDLTVAVLLMDGDGTIRHRFGGRDRSDDLPWLEIEALVRVMRATLEERGDDAKRAASGASRPASAPARAPRRTIASLEPFARRDRKKRVECVHCHNIHDFEREAAREAKTWKPDDIWIWPAPAQVGLELDPLDQPLVRSVAADSAAAVAGLQAGDRLVSAGDQLIASILDLEWVLHRAPGGDALIGVRFRRGDEEKIGSLKLPSGWKVCSPADFAWRPSKWSLRPQPGFGGKALTDGEKLELGIPAERFASRVTYLVTWGEDAETGRNAERAGLRKGDVLLGAGPMRSFESEGHFQSWFRLSCKPGTKVPLLLWRDGKEVSLDLPVLP